MTAILDQKGCALLFSEARTYGAFRPDPVPEEVLHKAWDLARMAPTAFNCLPARIVFVRSPEAKARLKPALSPGNADKTMAAPVTAIVAYDLEFYEHLPKLFPHMDAKALFVGNDAMIQGTAFRNGTLQGAYFILALRAVGLDCGAMSGFDNAKVDAEFFAGTPVKSNFLLNIGYGDASKLYPRGPRLDFTEACSIL